MTIRAFAASLNKSKRLLLFLVFCNMSFINSFAKNFEHPQILTEIEKQEIAQYSKDYDSEMKKFYKQKFSDFLPEELFEHYRDKSLGGMWKPFKKVLPTVGQVDNMEDILSIAVDHGKFKNDLIQNLGSSFKSYLMEKHGVFAPADFPHIFNANAKELYNLADKERSNKFWFEVRSHVSQFLYGDKTLLNRQFAAQHGGIILEVSKERIDEIWDWMNSDENL